MENIFSTTKTSCHGWETMLIWQRFSGLSQPLFLVSFKLQTQSHTNIRRKKKIQCNNTPTAISICNTGELFGMCLSCHAFFLPFQAVRVFTYQTQGYKNALWHPLEHWPLQKATDLFKTAWYTVLMWVGEHVCAFRPVHTQSCFNVVVCAYGCTHVCVRVCVMMYSQ